MKTAVWEVLIGGEKLYKNWANVSYALIDNDSQLKWGDIVDDCVICIYNIESKNKIHGLFRLTWEKDENNEAILKILKECGNIKCFNCFYQVIWGVIASVFRDIGGTSS